jgi:hypothetical protein
VCGRAHYGAGGAWPAGWLGLTPLWCALISAISRCLQRTRCSKDLQGYMIGLIPGRGMLNVDVRVHGVGAAPASRLPAG